MRAMLAEKGVISVAADGFGAPGVVVSYTTDPEIQNGKKFAAEGMQIAAGVPRALDALQSLLNLSLDTNGRKNIGDGVTHGCSPFPKSGCPRRSRVRSNGYALPGRPAPWRPAEVRRAPGCLVVDS